MKRNWTSDELLEHFTLSPEEMDLAGKKLGARKLGFLVSLKFFQIAARFPIVKEEIPRILIKYIAKQLNIPVEIFEKYNLKGRTYRQYNQVIREHFGFRETLPQDYELINNLIYGFTNWYDKEKVKFEVYKKFRELKIVPPPVQRVERLINAGVSSSEKRLFDTVNKRLPGESKIKLDELLATLSNNDNVEVFNEFVTFNELRSDPGRIGLGSLFKEIHKLRTIRELQIPESLLDDQPSKLVKKYKLRVSSELLGEIKSHPSKIRYALLSMFFWIRSKEITDNLVDLLIQIIHKISSNAEKKVVKKLVQDIKKVSGKNNILYKMAQASLQYPDGTVRNVIYPIAKQEMLQSLVKDLKNNQHSFKGKVFTVIKGSYSHHYRRMFPEILGILDFKSNNESHKPVIEALEVVWKFLDLKMKFIELDSEIPIDGVLPSGWNNPLIQKQSNGQYLIEKVEYEICVLQVLREKLRCKEIWVTGADKYRNPEEDLPQDFEERREEYFESLNQPEDPEPFVNSLQKEMEKSLYKLNKSVSSDPKVNIHSKNGGRIVLTPFEKQKDPKNIELLKSEILKKWPMVDLLDILKESDLMINFTENFKTTGEREILDKETLRRRLLMVLFALGTNTGLKRIASSTIDPVSFDSLRYLKRKYIYKDNLRNAIVSTVNAIHKKRLGHIWGEGTTSCASDSKKFGAWDQNLMTEWHIRYRGRGVMIYWHVEKNSTCIYSQLKSCSSSEVAAMIEGVLRHCTDLTVDRNYVDTHGQSEVAFAFSHLLNFSLMPRFKSLSKKKLYIPNNDIKNDLPNIKPILTRNIKWNLIREQYDQMIKYTMALKMGTASTEAIMKRFTKNNLQHPTYKALQELGKVVKTIFLCEYLSSESLRIEINEGLNVVENWNSANGFIFYGKSGEISTNNLEDQELSVLCLNLLQNCLVYINTLMIQEILSKSKWQNVLESEDLRALSPLIYKHINPYGKFELNMKERIPLNTS